MRSLLLCTALLVVGCHEEPTIVITFAPQDLSSQRVDAASPVEMAKKPDAAVAGDLCKSDRECVLVPHGCCPCSSGGTKRSIARARERDYLRQHNQVCSNSDTMCVAMLSKDPSCDGVATCIDGRCGFRSKK